MKTLLLVVSVLLTGCGDSVYEWHLTGDGREGIYPSLEECVEARHRIWNMEEAMKCRPKLSHQLRLTVDSL